MAEQDSKPTAGESDQTPGPAITNTPMASRRLLPIALGIVVLLVGCFWWGSQSSEPPQTNATSTPLPQSTNTSRPQDASAALTRVASSLAQAQIPLPTTTPTPITADSALIPLPTLTPTLVPSPVATRTVELRGEATLRLHLQSEAFASSGQPVTIGLQPRNYVLGGDSMSQRDRWCSQVGPVGLIFDLTYTLQPVTENVLVAGELQLYDGFCGEWGRLGNQLSTAPMNVTVPVGTSVLLAPSLQFQGSLLGLPNVLDISTGVYLDLSIRNPIPR